MFFLHAPVARHLLILVFGACAATVPVLVPALAYEDRQHFSRVFQAERPYRIFLPENYQNSNKRYPVIYLFHGNGGSHASDPYAKPDYERIDRFVKRNGVILAMWNGRSEQSDTRPYNMGAHEHVKYPVQFKDYFLEFVAHIDGNYRTRRDRSSRATVGFSMGGFMSLYLAGKYPHLIGSAVNLVGSPAFFLGHPRNHTFYPLKALFGNLQGVRLRFHNSASGELKYLNQEVIQGAQREKGLLFEHAVYPGGHKMDDPGEFKAFGDAFQFVMAALEKPLPAPDRWHHLDIYPKFDVWGYSVSSNLAEPGFIEMKGVTRSGLRIGSRRWLPDGPPVDGVRTTVTSAARYEPNVTYRIFDYNEAQGKASTSKVQSDASGRITFSVNHEDHQIGIHRSGGPAEPVVTAYSVNEQSRFVHQGRDSQLKLQVLNRGASPARGLTARITTAAPGARIENRPIAIPDIPAGEARWSDTLPIVASGPPPTDGSLFRIRLDIVLSDQQGTTWKDEIDVDVFFQVPEFTAVVVVDGVQSGRGNGNGIPAW